MTPRESRTSKWRCLDCDLVWRYFLNRKTPDHSSCIACGSTNIIGRPEGADFSILVPTELCPKCAAPLTDVHNPAICSALRLNDRQAVEYYNSSAAESQKI